MWLSIALCLVSFALGYMVAYNVVMNVIYKEGYRVVQHADRKLGEGFWKIYNTKAFDSENEDMNRPPKGD